MNSVDKTISELFGSFNIVDYNNVDLRKKMHSPIADVVNQNIKKIDMCHNPELEEKLKKDGYLIFDNFFSQEEVTELQNTLSQSSGYNAHVPLYSDNILRKLTSEYEFNTLSYPPNILLQNKTILNKIINPLMLSLAQGYLGCFPTLYSLNSWWHFYNGQVYGTQQNHRDHDDFKFLALFVFLTDVNDTNGPHVFYPGTQDGSSSDKSIAISGKAGTAILADTFAIHRGQPLQQGSRLVCWWRYGLCINAMHYHDGNNNYKSDKQQIFSNIPQTEHNEYLFRAFY
jgi:hypothetical protein